MSQNVEIMAWGSWGDEAIPVLLFNGPITLNLKLQPAKPEPGVLVFKLNIDDQVYYIAQPAYSERGTG
jgi:hypothetical protein